MPRRILAVVVVSLVLLARCAGMDGDPKVGAANPQTYLADFARLARIDWPKNRTLTVVCFGHSVPAGYAKTPEVRALDAYPNLLRVALAEKYPHAVINVIVSAIGGENSAGGAARFERDVVPLHPDVLLVDYALNDRAIGLEKAKVAWDAIIARAKTQGMRVLLLTPTADERDKISDPNSPLHQHAAQIRQLAASYDVGLVDSLARFEAYVGGGGALTDLMAQVNHPNRRGHELVAQALLEWFH